MNHTSSIVTMIFVATLFNIYGEVSDKKSQPYMKPIVGGFIVLVFLLAIGETKASSLGFGLAAAFTITSITINGAPVISAIDKFVGSSSNTKTQPKQTINTEKAV